MPLNGPGAVCMENISSYNKIYQKKVEKISFLVIYKLSFGLYRVPGALKKRGSYSFQDFDVKYFLIFYVANSMGGKKSAN